MSSKNSARKSETDATKGGDSSLTEQQRRDVENAFNLFDANNEGKLKTKELKIAMRALGFEPKREEIQKILADIKKEGAEHLTYDDFVSIMRRKYSEKDVMEEIKKAFQLFDDDRTGLITLENLKRVAEKLQEKFKDEDLQEMIDEADRDGDGALNLEEFAFVMQKTNLY